MQEKHLLILIDSHWFSRGWDKLLFWPGDAEGRILTARSADIAQNLLKHLQRGYAEFWISSPKRRIKVVVISGNHGEFTWIWMQNYGTEIPRLRLCVNNESFRSTLPKETRRVFQQREEEGWRLGTLEGNKEGVDDCRQNQNPQHGCHDDGGVPPRRWCGEM